jgi:hypothetical protein
MGVRCSIDVEHLRVSAERDACARLERDDPRARALYAPLPGASKRRGLLGNALLLTESMAPEAYAAARDAMASLGVENTIELFQSAGHGVDTARLVLDGDPIGIEFIGGYLASLDRASLLAVLGHEIGHCVAHRRNPDFAWALTASQQGNTPIKRAYAMAAELTADRFGLLACRDLDAVLRLEMQAAAGRSATSIHFDTRSYLRQCRAVSEELLANGETMLGTTHPEHYVRGYAEWLFSESDLYATMTGSGEGLRTIFEVEATLWQLLGLRPGTGAPTAAWCAASPPPADVGVAVVGERDDEAAAKKAVPPQTLERVAADILTDGARRKLAATGKAIVTIAHAVAPSIRRAAEAAREQLRTPASQEEPVESADDPLDEERRELLARFAELERREKK